MAESNVLHVGGHNYVLVGDSTLPKGKRKYIRSTRPSQPTESWELVRRWKLSGPLGASRQGADGYLGCEWATLDHRYPDLLTSLPAVTAVSVAGADPIASGAAALGAMPLGGRALAGGTSQATPQTITHIEENTQRLLMGRGAFLTQLNIGSWAVEKTTKLNGAVRGLANWFRKLRIGLGDAGAVQTVTGITTTGHTLSDTQVSATNVFANELLADTNRLVMVRADPAQTNANRIRWTPDDFASLSGGASGAGFFVGDPGVNATGLGTMGEYTVVGSEDGLFGFTPEGIPFNIVRALKDAASQQNGKKIAEQFGWTYITSSLGLYACRPGPVANPVGIGSPAYRGFEGFDGIPVAVMAWREILLVAYQSSAGSTWRILAGEYGPQTDATGELNWYLLASRTVGSVQTFFATSTPTNPNIGWGEGANAIARIVMGRAGRDISDSNYVFSTGGGQWFGTALMEQQHLRKTARWARFFPENAASGNSWTLALSFDGGSYSNVGSAVTANGPAKVVPATPTSAPTGFVPKPRLTQVAGGGSASTTPPQLRGDLEIAFDVRPDMVDEIKAVVGPLSRAEVTRLRALADGEDTTGRQPLEIRLPDSPGTLRYGFVKGVDDEDADAAEVPVCTLTLVTWETS